MNQFELDNLKMFTESINNTLGINMSYPNQEFTIHKMEHNGKFVEACEHCRKETPKLEWMFDADQRENKLNSIEKMTPKETMDFMFESETTIEQLI